MQQSKNAAAFKAIKHVSKSIEIIDDANHDAIVLVQLQTLKTPTGPIMEMEAVVCGCPCRLREILINIMEKDKNFAVAVLSAAQLYKTKADNDFNAIESAFHKAENIDPSKN